MTLQVGERVHLIAGHVNGVIRGFAPKVETGRGVVPGAHVQWDGDEGTALWALDELERERRDDR